MYRTSRKVIDVKVLVPVVSIYLIKGALVLHTLISTNNVELLGYIGKAAVLKYPWSHWSPWRLEC